jgi:prevent-host-death family protein
MLKVNVRPVRDLRNNYAEIESLLENHDQVIITKNGRGSAVLIPFDEYAEFEEYTHHKYIVEKLSEAETEAAKPYAKRLDAGEVMKRLRRKYRGD